jgi:hypothetical protein
VFVEASQADEVVQAATAAGMTARRAGHLEAGDRAVELAGLGITYSGSELELG